MKRREGFGFTLLEIMVSMGILVMLGVSLMVILRGGLSIWTKSEARRESSQVAQGVLEMLREDLESTTIYHRPDSTGLVQTMLLCDLDQVQRGGPPPQRVLRQRLFLTRSIKGESENPLTGLAGSTLGAQGIIDLHRDRDEGRQQSLRSTGGLMEVGYVLGAQSQTTLYRLLRSPIGGTSTLFSFDRLPPQRIDPKADAVVARLRVFFKGAKGLEAVERVRRKIVVLLNPKGDAILFHQELDKAPYKKELDKLLDSFDMELEVRETGESGAARRYLYDRRLETWGRPIAEGVLFLGFEFWHQYTASWDAKPRRFRGRREHGALGYWDSTRARLRPSQNDGSFSLFKSAASLNDPRDDILPERVRITLVLREPVKAKSESALVADISGSDDELRLASADPIMLESGYVLIDNEWIHFKEKSGDTLIVDSGGRGARGTTPAPHLEGSSVIWGRSFEMVVAIPTATEDWGR